MNTKLEFLKRIYSYLLNPNLDSLNLSMADTHHEGLFSLVIHGTEFGKLTRIFISHVDLKPFEVQLHTHRYPITLTAIKGQIMHHTAFEIGVLNHGSFEMSVFEYKSPLNGGAGLKYLKESPFLLIDTNIPAGSTLKMKQQDIHTVSCSKGSIWIVEEGGFEADSSIVLGVPFATEGLYNKPPSFAINDNHQTALHTIKRLILSYETVE